jgi:hypothetical protein
MIHWCLKLRYDQDTVRMACHLFRFEGVADYTLIISRYACDIPLDESYSEPSEVDTNMIYISIVR